MAQFREEERVDIWFGIACVWSWDLKIRRGGGEPCFQESHLDLGVSTNRLIQAKQNHACSACCAVNQIGNSWVMRRTRNICLEASRQWQNMPPRPHLGAVRPFVYDDGDRKLKGGTKRNRATETCSSSEWYQRMRMLGQSSLDRPCNSSCLRVSSAVLSANVTAKSTPIKSMTTKRRRGIETKALQIIQSRQAKALSGTECVFRYVWEDADLSSELDLLSRGLKLILSALASALPHQALSGAAQ